MNQVTQRKIPEEWTSEMWKAHVCAMEKRMNELERDVHNLKQANLSPMSQMSRSFEKIAEYRENQQGIVCRLT